MPTLISTSVLLPLIMAGLARLSHNRAYHRGLSILVGLGLMILSIAVYRYGPCAFSPHPAWDIVIRSADYLLLFIILAVALRLRSRLSVMFILLQIGLLATLEFGMIGEPEAGPKFLADPLALVMALVVNGVGGLTLIYSPSYITAHNDRLHLKKGSEGTFFFFMILFLGAMNGLIFANDGLWFLFFWELTTVSSFALIAHDRTRESITSTLRALWMTMLGGAALLIGLFSIYWDIDTLYLDRIVDSPGKGIYLSGVAFLCLAGFTKAAQVPFQKWLLGAMAAPAPVSALLHSSTMVKAGTFLILRLTPVYQGNFLGTGVAWVGTFSFLAMGAVAVSKADSKRILAHPTILNLGLIIACAGLGGSLALTAALLILVFHAIAKALLFLCVGAAELEVEHRTLDSLKGLGARLPLTTSFMVIGLLALLLPPFGLIVGKWLLLEKAVMHPPVLFFLVLGMAFHMLLYARWAGDLLCIPHQGQWWHLEKQSWSLRSALAVLTLVLIIFTPLIPALYPHAVSPVLRSLGVTPFAIHGSTLITGGGAFHVMALTVALALAAISAALVTRRFVKPEAARPAYACGAQATIDGKAGYKGPFNQMEEHSVGPCYFQKLFNHPMPARIINMIGVAILVILFVRTL